MRRLPVLSLQFSQRNSGMQYAQLALQQVIRIFIGSRKGHRFTVIHFKHIVSGSLHPGFHLLWYLKRNHLTSFSFFGSLSTGLCPHTHCGFIRYFPQHCHKQAFTRSLMRQETVNRKLCTGQISRNVPVRLRLQRKYLCPQFLCNPCHIVLIFLPIICTRAINQQSSGLQARPYIP